METLQSVGTMLLMLLLFIGILFLAWWTTRLIARKSGPVLGGGTQNMKILEKLCMGQDKNLLLVRVADKTLLLSATGEEIRLLCEVDGQALQLDETAAPQTSFLEVLRRQRQAQKKPLSEERQEPHD